MKKKTLSPVFLHVIDEYGQISGDISQRFDNPEKYVIKTHVSFRHFIEKIEHTGTTPIRRKTIRIIICVISRHMQNHDPVSEALHILDQINKLPDKYSVIFLVDSSYKDKGQKVLESGAGAWIINNSNAIHWIDNHVKGTISRNNLNKKRKASLFAIRVLITYVVIVLLFTLIARVLFPWYF